MAQELSQEQQDLLSEICVVVANSISAHTNKEIEKVDFEDKVHTLFDGNVYRFGHMLLDVHEIYDLKLWYEPLSEFETFATVSDVVRYFFEQMLEERNLA